MKKFDVEITETLQRKVSVEAASQEDAERIIKQAIYLQGAYDREQMLK